MALYQTIADMLRRHMSLKSGIKIGYAFIELLKAEGMSHINTSTIRPIDRVPMKKKDAKIIIKYLMGLTNLTHMGSYYCNLTIRHLDGFTCW